MTAPSRTGLGDAEPDIPTDPNLPPVAVTDASSTGLPSDPATRTVAIECTTERFAVMLSSAVALSSRSVYGPLSGDAEQRTRCGVAVLKSCMSFARTAGSACASRTP